MRTLLLHASNFETFWAHYYVHQDPDFLNKLAELGYRLVLSNQVENITDCDYALFSEAYSVGLYRFRMKSKLKHYIKKFVGQAQRDFYGEFIDTGMFDKLALMVFEVPIHLPVNINQRLFSMFPLVFSWNDDLVDGQHVFKFQVPQPAKWPDVKPVPFSKKRLLVSILSNKYSDHPLELYSARRRDIHYFSETLSDNFGLYGFGWNLPVTLSQRIFKSFTPLYKSYRGLVNDKTAIFPKYRFALCYENANIPGNIDEKIFECMRSDCVPIFLGAPNVKDYVDKDAFVDRRDFASEDELRRFLNDMTEYEYNRYREAIRSYLVSPHFARFLSPAFAETIIKGLELSPK